MLAYLALVFFLGGSALYFAARYSHFHGENSHNLFALKYRDENHIKEIKKYEDMLSIETKLYVEQAYEYDSFIKSVFSDLCNLPCNSCEKKKRCHKCDDILNRLQKKLAMKIIWGRN